MAMDAELLQSLERAIVDFNESLARIETASEAYFQQQQDRAVTADKASPNVNIDKEELGLLIAQIDAALNEVDRLVSIQSDEAI